MNSRLFSSLIFTISALLAICFGAQPALAVPSHSVQGTYVVQESGSKNDSLLFTYKGDPSQQFNEKADATIEYPIFINRAILVNIEGGQELSIMLPEQISVTIVHQKTLRPSSGNSVTLVGFLKEFGQRYKTLITIHNDTIRGKIITPDGVLRLLSTPSGDLLVDQRDSNRIPGYLGDDMLLPPDAGYKASAYPLKKMAASGNSTIDLMLLYTAGYAAKFPGDQLLARFNELVAIANAAYSDSGVYITLNLVHTVQVSYSDTVSNYDALDNLTDGVSGFSNVAALRTQYGADLVSLIRPYSSAFGGNCGVAWVNGSQGQDISLFASSGYSAVADGEYTVGIDTYFCGDLTLPHELGHNMGCAHDRGNSSDGSSGDPFDGAYSYSYGYGIDGSFGTIMSYIKPEVAFFSNPDITTCDGQACGVDESQSNSANNALTLNNTREAIAAFTSSAAPIDLNNPDIYKALTDSSDYTIPTGTSAIVYGTSAVNRIILESGAGVKLRNFIGSNIITIQSDSSLFSMSRSGATVTIEGTDGTILSIAASPTSQTIVFNDGSFTLVISGSAVYFNGQVVTSTPALL